MINLSTHKMPHIGYKKIRDDLIVRMEICGKHNEDRKNVYDVMYAEHRCSEALVLDIYDMFDETKKATEGYSVQDWKFKYKVGEIVKVEDYCNDLDVVNASGLHYFLTEECAFFMFRDVNDFPKWKGVYKEWRDNGMPHVEIGLKNGKLYGVYEMYIDGKIIVEGNYKYNRRVGEWKLYDRDRSKSRTNVGISRITFKNVVRRGIIKKRRCLSQSSVPLSVLCPKRYGYECQKFCKIHMGMGPFTNISIE